MTFARQARSRSIPPLPNYRTTSTAPPFSDATLRLDSAQIQSTLVWIAARDTFDRKWLGLTGCLPQGGGGR